MSVWRRRDIGGREINGHMKATRPTVAGWQYLSLNCDDLGGWCNCAYHLGMAECCCSPSLSMDPHRGDPAYRRVLWSVLGINVTMFLVEIVAGVAAGSASLQADALDFLGDAGNYAISLFVVGMALRYRALAALAKGATMGAFGLWVVGATIWHAVDGTVPHAIAMGAVQGITRSRKGRS
jgi:hypothetical protein